MNEEVTLLSSGNSLGVYMPALRLRNRLRARGVPARIEMLETLYDDATRARIPRTREAFHDRFDVARAALRLARDSGRSLEEARVRETLARWQAEGRRRFWALTGFWLPVLEQAAAMRPEERLDIRFIRLDAADTPSYAVFGGRMAAFPQERLYGELGDELAATLPVDDAEPIPYARRDLRFLLHGGGWGIGTYREAEEELRRAGHAVHLIAYREQELGPPEPDRSCGLLDPDWSPWETDAEGRHVEPPYAEPSLAGRSVAADAMPLVPVAGGIWRRIREAAAIVSKPGGATLLDSLSAATPLLLLAPYGEHEQANARLWERLGFGMAFERWSALGCPLEPLAAMHERLAQARRLAPDLAERLLKGGEPHELRRHRGAGTPTKLPQAGTAARPK
ncbi:hypothetical protein HGI30_06055 [Paenibacillus albicereus]|uniref:UDP-glucuronosyltransferase n=1 Tax=Paenibacillus albicereus TaxID=2726185 RepID=A0A6H2GUT2_9BACL|nr:hypothetical protein [Paenibacillus albicereus]QJC51170.1 hypothetical protein HGI30_06055 [Paenibacillus albicereus]